jgi:SUMO ligase MMS21 Smc5/6 complex component
MLTAFDADAPLNLLPYIHSLISLKVNHFYAVDEACIVRRMEMPKYAVSRQGAKQVAFYRTEIKQISVIPKQNILVIMTKNL